MANGGGFVVGVVVGVVVEIDIGAAAERLCRSTVWAQAPSVRYLETVSTSAGPVFKGTGLL